MHGERLTVAGPMESKGSVEPRCQRCPWGLGCLLCLWGPFGLSVLDPMKASCCKCHSDECHFGECHPDYIGP